MDRLARWSPILLSILRIVAALLFIEHGLMKLFHLPAPQARAPDPLPTLLLVAAWLETVGGALLAIGLAGRPVAVLLSGEMAVAYFMQHASKSFWPGINGGEGAILFCFTFLYIAAAGAGPWSLDAMLRGRTRNP